MTQSAPEHASWFELRVLAAIPRIDLDGIDGRLFFFLTATNVFLHLNMDVGGGFKYFLFSPLFGEGFQFDYLIFFKWVETTN